MFASFTTRPNRWDWALLPLVLAVLIAVAYGAMQMARPFVLGQPMPVRLDPVALPYYLLRTILRMFAALGVSLVFAFVFAAVAAKYRLAEKVLVPLLDVLQSVPVLGFQAIAIAPFIALFPGSQMGVECAAIFAIFTSQAWNMAFSLYQSMRAVPAELHEASRMFRLSAWQRFWRLELPFAMPGLLWNMMISWWRLWRFPSPGRTSNCPASAPTSRWPSKLKTAAPSPGPSALCSSALSCMTSCSSGLCWYGRTNSASKSWTAKLAAVPGCWTGCAAAASPAA
jgi:NitT/TauT family transport system permease protein